MIGVAVVGDREIDHPLHRATDAAVEHAAAALGVKATTTWLATTDLRTDPARALAGFDAVWVAPGTYASAAGAQGAVSHARTRDLPLLGTCGGFQQVVLEFAHHVCGLPATHAEDDPDEPDPVISELTCSLVGTAAEVQLAPGSRVERSAGSTRVVEQFACRFGLNPGHLDTLTHAGLVVSGVDADHQPRVVELPTLAFYVATLFVPQATSAPDAPHPLVVAFLDTARGPAR